MVRRALFGVLSVSALVVAASAAYAGKVELTTYFPAPNAEYQELQASKTLTVPDAPLNARTVDNTAVGEIWVEPV